MSIAPLAITDDEKLSKEQSVPISPSDTLVPSERDVEAGTAASVKRKQPLIRKGTFIDHLRKPESSFRRSWSWLVRRLTKTDSERTTSDIGDEQAEDEDLEDPWSCNITRSLDNCPEGYPQVATFQSSDCNFMLYRGFSYVHCRVLSALQHDIERLERQLDAFDLRDSTGTDTRSQLKLKSQTRDEIESAKDKATKTSPTGLTRPEILTELKQKLVDYDDVLFKAPDMCAMQRPSRRDYKSVRNWFRNNEPIIQQEMSFVRCKEDLVSLRTGREYAGFDSLVERCLSRLDSMLVKHLKCHILRKMFLTPELRAKSSDEDIHYYSPERVEKLVNMIITGIIFILLILPVVALYELSDVGTRASPFEAIGILIIFTLLFSGAMSALTKARRQELFAASAAYCAVLVVFIGNFSTQSVVLISQ